MSTRVENRRMIFAGAVRHEHPVDTTLMADFVKVVPSNGTTVVNVFGLRGAPHKLTISGIFVIAKDTTAGNITVKIGANTVATIAKGTVAGVVTGAASLTTPIASVGDVLTIVSSSAGDVYAYITYTYNS